MPTANKRNERIRGEVTRLAMSQKSGADSEPGGDADQTETVTTKEIVKHAPKSSRRDLPQDDEVDLLPDSEEDVGDYIEKYGQFDESKMHPGIKRIMERAESEGVPFGGYPRRRSGERKDPNQIAEAAAESATVKSKLPPSWVGMGGIQYTQNADGSLKVFFPKTNRTAVARPGDEAYHAILGEWQKHGDQSDVNWQSAPQAQQAPEKEEPAETPPEAQESVGTYDMRQDMPGGGKTSIDEKVAQENDLDEAAAIKLIAEIQAGGADAQDAKARYDDSLKNTMTLAATGPFAFPLQVSEKTGASLVSMLPEGNLKRVGETLYGSDTLGEWMGRQARDVGRLKEDVTPYLFDPQDKVQASLEDRKVEAASSPEAFKAFIMDEDVPLEAKLDVMMENPQLAE